MKTLTLFSMLTLSTLLLSCDKINPPGCPPPFGKECVERKLLVFQEDENTCADATINSYMFQGELVYVMDYGTCIADMTSEVLNDDCRTLGYLGGFAGGSTINGVDFWSNAIFVAQIWHK
ncbi:DUF6970 domain-containing protein [Edaphocola aurantiacus]|uniref:DUF6970 domain-containing protein n=1 Tax=Edaphocola aurantiacus TaxID=2601682 RepID=UPI001C9685A5|nr:hypothetical protein [Edaphocola aurantiacus]